MALTSTLYTGLSGMSTNQARLNVIGNNIANVNTVAFKSSRALFKPQFYVTDTSGSAPNAEFGGTNPNQRGLGSTVATIQKNFNGGSIETTGQATDLAIDGDGFFIVGNHDTSYTRDGSFTLNESNELVTTRGEYVKGYGVDSKFNIVPGNLTNLSIPIGGLTVAQATTKVDFKGNLNADGAVAGSASKLLSEPLAVDGGGTLDGATALVDLRRASSPTDVLFTAGEDISLNPKRGGEYVRPESQGPLTFTISATTTVDELSAFFQQAMGIDTSTATTDAAPAGYEPGVTLAAALPGDPAGSGRLQIIGNAGAMNALEVASNDFNTNGTVPFAFANADGEPDVPVGEGAKTTVKAYDSLGNAVDMKVYTALESKSDEGNTYRFWAYSATDTDTTGAFDPAATGTGGVLGSGTITFDNNGKYKDSTGTQISVDRDDTGTVTPLNIDLHFDRLTSLSDEGTASAIAADEQDGLPTGSLDGYSIGADGKIVGTFTNGLKRDLGQVAVATFDNQQGLIDMGSNNYKIGASSGQPIVTAPQQFNAGAIRAGSLEQSNVDLSKEFIDMIITSTGFSASSRVISTADRLMTELLQTTR